MKVSELIAHLEDFQKEHGDLVVKMFDNIYEDYYPVRQVGAHRDSDDGTEAFGEIV